MNKSETIKELSAALAKAQGCRFAESVTIPPMLNQILERKPGKTVRERFFNKVAFGASDCWYWRGSQNRLGYGCMSALGESKAHRVSYRLFRGDPGGLSVLHRCDVRNCVNPDHLYLGTQLENMRDCRDRGRNKVIPLPGERNPMARLTAYKVGEMRRIRQEQGLSAQKLGRMFGVSTMTAHRAIKGESWK
jgi:hypothetical protein